ncbi:MAG: hypothetical protein JSR18_14535 [Proteobacteria bacterium]|nr:hypothetical protein [Pseudomonadota bacterium]
MGQACAGVVALLITHFAYAATVTYTSTQTFPVPPASTFAGSGGGDGWALAMTSTDVYNVFHHQGSLTVACHHQADAAQCWSPITVVDASSRNFATSGQPGLWIDPATARLYTYATRDDATAGVVCFDTVVAATAGNPFCGFTALSAVGEAALAGNGYLGNPSLVGSRAYSFNYVPGVGVAGTQNTMLCFDRSTLAACAGQPYTVAFDASNVAVGNFPEPAQVAIGNQIIVPIATVSGGEQLACLNGTTAGGCGGVWPVSLGGGGYVGNAGAAFPLLSAGGTLQGLCLPNGAGTCFGLDGALVPAPANLAAALPANDGWNGPAFVLGPRVYLANGNVDQVFCFDYSTGNACVNFPIATPGAGYIYTTNPDPQRPTCVWINADYGTAQIQNFDAYTGGSCGSGDIRILAASFVAPGLACVPGTYVSLRLVAPTRGTYTSGTVMFTDGDGNPIPGAPTLALDGSGSVDLTGLDLSTATGLPQFIITLVGAGEPGSVVVTLTWTGADDPACGASVRPSAPPPQPVPTLSSVALALLALLLGASVLMIFRHRNG